MDNTTTMYIVIGVLTVFFIVLLIFSAKTWRILHLLSAFFVFIAAGFLVWFAAATLKTTTEWRRAVTVLTVKVDDEKAKAQALLDGTPGEDRPAMPGSSFDEFEYQTNSIHDVRAALERTLLDRGRVWRKCTAVVSNPGAAIPSISVTIPVTSTAGVDPVVEAPPADPADPADPPVDPAPPPAPGGSHAIEDNTIVYGFAESESELEGELRVAGFNVPRIYLGEFRVLNHTNNTVTLTPTIPLTQLQAASLEASTWTIYDNMPVDRHNAFVDMSDEDLRLLFPRENLSMTVAQYREEIARLATFFDGMSPDQLAAKVPMAKVVMSDAQYDELLQSFQRDGKEADINTDPPNRVWFVVRFKAPTSIQIDAVPTTAGGDPTTANYEKREVVAKKNSDNEIIIAESSLFPPKNPGEPEDKILGNFALGITVADKLKQVSDATIDELWVIKPTVPWNPDAPPTLTNLAALSDDQKREVLPVIREKKSIEFDLGDTTLVDERTARFLLGLEFEGRVGTSEPIIEGSKLEDLQAIYVRQLRDYATYFNDDYRFNLQFEDEAKIIKQDTVTLVGANAKALEQVNYRAGEITKLQSDRDGFQREAVAIAEVLAAIEARNKATRASLSQLYTTNQQLAAKIRTMQTQMADAIRRADQGSNEPDAADLPAAVSAP